jgi:hypothetical protein
LLAGGARVARADRDEAARERRIALLAPPLPREYRHEGRDADDEAQPAPDDDGGERDADQDERRRCVEDFAEPIDRDVARVLHQPHPAIRQDGEGDEIDQNADHECPQRRVARACAAETASKAITTSWRRAR